jgi:dienelactone hydrolase
MRPHDAEPPPAREVWRVFGRSVLTRILPRAPGGSRRFGSIRILPRPSASISLAVSVVLAFAAEVEAQDRLTVRTEAFALPEATLDVELHLPQGVGPFPVVVVVNSSAGARDVTLKRAADIFVPRGIAIAAVDTYSPRGISDTIADHSRISSWHMAVDALHVAEALRADQVAVMGQSKGAVASFNLAFRFMNGHLAPARQRFDAYLLLAPACELQYPDTTLNGPMSAVLAERDDLTPASTCIALFDRMKGLGAPISVTVVPGANHNWSTQAWVYDPAVYSTRGCQDKPLTMLEPGRYRDGQGSIVRGPEVCGERGGHVLGNRDRLDFALETQAQFLKSLGW